MRTFGPGGLLGASGRRALLLQTLREQAIGGALRARLDHLADRGARARASSHVADRAWLSKLYGGETRTPSSPRPGNSQSQPCCPAVVLSTGGAWPSRTWDFGTFCGTNQMPAPRRRRWNEPGMRGRPGGTAGRPGSSPPAPATRSAGADQPVCRNPQAGHRCSGNWTQWRCRRLGCYRRPARRPRSRAAGHRPHPRTRPAARGAGHQHKPAHKGTPQRPRRLAHPHSDQ